MSSGDRRSRVASCRRHPGRCRRGRDTRRALALAQRVESGICHINGPTVHDEAQMPFGGVKSSGYGSFGGKAAIEQFTQLRWVTLQSGPRYYPI